VQTGQSGVRHSRGKYVTLVVLVAWVLAVFLFTLWKFSTVVR